MSWTSLLYLFGITDAPSMGLADGIDGKSRQDAAITFYLKEGGIFKKYFFDFFGFTETSVGGGKATANVTGDRSDIFYPFIDGYAVNGRQRLPVLYLPKKPGKKIGEPKPVEAVASSYKT